MLNRIKGQAIQNLNEKWIHSKTRIIASRLTKPKPDKAETRHGGNLVASVLKSNSIENIFVLSGGHVSPIFTGCESVGINVVDLRNEASAVFAADAAARLTGKVGVAVVTAGPGVTNTVTAIKNAQMAGSPLLVIGGAAATQLKGRGALQDIPQRPILEAVCKKTFTVTTVRDIVPTIKEALFVAQDGMPGPVFLEMPIDTLYPYAATASEIIGTSSDTSLIGKITSFYMNSYLHNLFTQGFEEQNFNVITNSLPIDPNQVTEVRELIKEAKRPLILLQSQATLQPHKLDEFALKLENLGIPVFLGGMARGLLGANSNVQCRHARGKALKNADLIILAGVSADFRLNYGRSLPRKAKIVTINRDPVELTKNTDLFWKPNISIQSDPCDFILEVLNSDWSKSTYSDWLEVCRQSDKKRDLEIDSKAKASAGGLVNPLNIFQKLDSILPDDAILVADGGDFVATASYILRPRSPLSWLDPGPYGTLGVGGGFAIGAATIFPNRPIFIIYGDGSAGYSLVEVDSAKRHGFNQIKVLIGNDGAWTQILRAQEQILGSPVANILTRSDYHKVGHAFDCGGLLIDGESDEEIVKGLSELTNATEPTVLNALIGTTDFREGSISV